MVALVERLIKDLVSNRAELGRPSRLSLARFKRTHCAAGFES